MKILVTEGEGLVGSRVSSDLQAIGHTVVNYDLEDSQDILDDKNLQAAV